jgi:hypothetical protein
VEKQAFKKAFASLILMSASFIAVFMNFLLDRIAILLTGQGFTVFYFMAWSFSLVGMIGAYLGYIRPRA